MALTARTVRATVEGIIVTGLFGFGFTLDYGSFEEASVLTAAQGAESPTPGIHTQFVTKSGANRYRGALYADYENRHWQSFNVDADQINRVAPSGGGLLAREANQLWHYHDVDADGGGFIIKDRLWWYSSIRDQEIWSRVVNFPVKPHVTRLTNYGGKGNYRIAPGKTLVLYGQREQNHEPNRLDPFSFGGSDLSAATAINETEDSTANQHNAGWVWKGEFDSVLNDRLLFEVRLGQFGTEQQWRARSASARFEDVETLLPRRKPGPAKQWPAQPGIWNLELLQRRPDRESPPQGRRRDHPVARAGHVALWLSGKRFAHSPERPSLGCVPLRHAVEIRERRVDILGVCGGLVAAEQPPDAQPRSSIRSISAVPARTGTPRRQPDGAAVCSCCRSDRLEHRRATAWRGLRSDW
jgi:hypothetical protein